MDQPAGTPFQRWIRRSGALRWIRKGARAIGAIIVGGITCVLSTTPDRVWSPLESTFQHLHDTAWLWLLAAFAATVIAAIIPKESDPVALNATNAILTKIQGTLFGEVEGAEAHHRITLFKQVRGLWFTKDTFGELKRPGRRWLIPVARSGYDTKNTHVRFRSPDDADKAEGIAGRAWARTTAVQVRELPDLASSTCSEDARRRYAEETFVTYDWVRAQKPRARSLMGFRVEDAQSARWGVLVVDSRSPTFDMQLAQAEFGAYAPVLAQLVQSL
ncbi:MAG: hypothetical protein OXI39_10080 [Gemmatimonadota bacterium]|uniref:hypothetical protein n=1 Tax=Candidatus Palauibacter scopulicola TaxID=3056741 RepID=UPI00239FE7E6|nr:hypothetical protein [Candidatus Palauibacter scopulicola]MDE2663334.1 hypothetical protein [Candidatus Palauibacter scopulicola]